MQPTSKTQVPFYRIPVMRPTIKAAPPKFVTKVMRNHYRTQSILSESSIRADKECKKSIKTIENVRDTLKTWKDAYEQFQNVIDARV